MDDDAQIKAATRRLLFAEPPVAAEVQEIPGAGSSAAEDPEKHIRVKVTINLDGNIVSHFKAEAKKLGRPYQSLINDVLREHVFGSRPEQLAKDVREVLLEDASFLEAVAGKLEKRKE